MFGVYEPGTRTIYTNGIPSTAAGVERLLDAIVQLDRERWDAPSPLSVIHKPAQPGPVLVQDGKLSKPR